MINIRLIAVTLTGRPGRDGRQKQTRREKCDGGGVAMTTFCSRCSCPGSIGVQLHEQEGSEFD